MCLYINYEEIVHKELTVGVIENYSYGEHIDNIDNKYKKHTKLKENY